MRLSLAAVALVVAVGPGRAGWAGGFPLDCHGWGATLSSLSSLNSRHAIMTGTVEPDDVQEYCERQNDDKAAIARCLIETGRETVNERPIAEADCPGHFVRFRDGNVVQSTKIPADDVSCAGFLTVQEMYVRLCPAESKRMRLNK